MVLPKPPPEGTGVGPQAKTEHLAQMRDPYVRAPSRAERGRLRTEAMAVTGSAAASGRRRGQFVCGWSQRSQAGPPRSHEGLNATTCVFRRTTEAREETETCDYLFSRQTLRRDRRRRKT